MMIESPCFDRKTKTDCPERTAECQANCPKFAAYKADKLKEYDSRAQAYKHAIILDKYEEQQIRKHKRRKN